MNIVDVYSQQYRWREWQTILDSLPHPDGQIVLDLGCGIGDLAADFSTRGASVVGIDINEEAIDYASNRRIANAEFRQSNLHTFRDPGICVDGIWSSFAAAYFPAFHDTLAAWIEHLRGGGWLALTEVDDLFGHHPLSKRTSELLTRYARDAMGRLRYDFHMGRKLSRLAEQVGLRVARQFAVTDAELSFSGKADPEVQKAWRLRFDRMHTLREFCGAEFSDVRDDFLNCLNRDDHHCTATVQCCIAFKNDTAPRDGQPTNE